MRNTVLWVFLAVVLASGCSVRKYAINKLGDALAQSGSTFASDDDPELVRQAVPFSLKLIESLIAESPRHPGLLLAAARGFTLYAYAFVQQPAEELESKDLTASRELRDRARRLYLRARYYGLRGLEARHPGFEKALRTHPASAVSALHKEELPMIYWTAASWAAAIALSKDHPEVVADFPLVEALADRALALDEAYEAGALHTFMMTFELARKGPPGDPMARVKRHFDRAMELAQDSQAGPLVSWAENVSVQRQNVGEFKSMLNRALAVDPNVRPEWRLENLVLQRRARWLLSRIEELFLVLDSNEEKAK
jgi:predicted anti-sigma-YlaC factor YlaD